MIRDYQHGKSGTSSVSTRQQSSELLIEHSGPMSLNAYSYSRLDAYSKCPLSFKLQYLDKASQDSSDPLEMGSAAHDFFETWVKHRIDHPEQSPSDDLIVAMAAKCFQKESRSQENFKDYIETCKKFVSTFQIDPEYPDVKTEVPIAFDSNWKLCDWFSPEVRFRAKIDYLAAPVQKPIKKIKIRDWKSGFAGSMDTYQLDCYSLAAAALYPNLEQVHVEFYFVGSGYTTAKLLEVKDSGITKVQIEALCERIDSDKKFKARPGARCINCAVASHCTEKPSDLIAISSPEIAVKLAEEISFLDAQRKSKTKALSAYCKEKGPVQTNGLVYAHWPKESMKIEIAPLLSTCVTYQVDPGEILNPDSRAVKKAMKQNPGFGEAISPYVTMETSTAFSAKKAEADDE